MTILAEPLALPARRRNAADRLWGLPVRTHLLGLALVLVALVPVVGTASSFLSDEGAAVIQGRSLASGRGWIVPEPLPAVDPDGRYYPLVNSDRGTRGFAPLAKHPAYSVLVAGAGRLGGVAAMVLLSVAGTVAAAGVAGGLARRLDPVLARPAVWAVGLASPLFFDGFLVMAHTLGAALAGGAVLCAVTAISDRRPAMALGVAACVGGAVLLRSEALLFAASLAIVALVVALRARPRAPALLVAAAALGAAASARLGETAWIDRIVGGVPPVVAVPSPVNAHGFLQGRLDSFLVTWLLPDYKAAQPFSLLVLAMVTGLIVAAVSARSVPQRRDRVLVAAGCAAVAGLAALVAAPATVVPGLLMAYPPMAAGLVLLRRAVLRDVAASLALATSALFALAVIATQYASGGTGEWGGRYFALVIPVVAPVVLLALHRQGRTLAPRVRRGAFGSIVICSAAMTIMALVSVRSSHQSWTRFVSSVDRAEQVAGAGRPVVTTWSAAPRFAWPVFDRSPWLLARPVDMQGLRASLTAIGVDRFVFVTVDIAADRDRLAGLDVIWADGPLDGGRRILVVSESGAPR